MPRLCSLCSADTEYIYIYILKNKLYFYFYVQNRQIHP